MDLSKFATHTARSRREAIQNALDAFPVCGPRHHHCPRCGPLPEVHPEGGKVIVRALKIFDEHGSYSQCLICSGHYNVLLHEVDNHDSRKGWFQDV